MAKFRVSDKVVFREIDDNVVLINLESGFYYSLNETGCFIFNRILDAQDSERIIEAVQQTFDVPESQAKLDFENFTQILERENILNQMN